MGPAMLDPGQDTISAAPHGRDVLGQQNEVKRQHPKPEDGKDAEEAADDEQQAHGDPQASR
jgi:hypothetical protein